MDDDKTQKERLEQELRFLKESFEAEVISKEEFEKGKDRIEKKLKEIKEPENKQPKEEKKEQTQELQEPIKGIIEKKEETKTAEAISKEEEKIEEPTIEPTKEIKEEKDNKLFKYSLVFVVLLLVIFFSYSILKENKKAPEKVGQRKIVVEVKEMPTNVLVLNDRKNCFNCDAQRVLGILENWFGVLNVNEIDYSTEQGKKLAEKLDAALLPLYILDKNITEKPQFEQFKQTFVKRGDNYVLSEDASGSTFYFRRENIPNKLDLFVIDGDDASIKAENNLKEFLDAFNEIKFEKHLSIDKLTQELNIKTFPTFLVNNRVKFSGVHSAETIKENFCKLNAVLGCEKSLSKSLV